ncbi:MAG: hypothetical protein QXZ25_04085 [Candidatus Bathyarchaeia archaeon]
MKRQQALIILFFILLIFIVGSVLHWHFENLAEEKLQDYITQLQSDGFTVEERHLTDFNVSGIIPIHFFSDFRSFAKQEGISHIYLDRKTRVLFFLHPINNQLEANVFYYQ